MLSDKKLFIIILIVLVIPISIIFMGMGKDRFRYECQDPNNWESPSCKMPACDVTRSCPEHIFKGQRDPRLGPPPAPGSVVQQAQCVSQCPGVQDGKQK